MDRPIAAADVTAWLDSFEPTAARALCAASVFGATFWRGGVLGRVLTDGDIAIGDEVRIEP